MLNVTPLPSTSAALAAQISDETGTGANVFATSPSLVTPVLGTPASGDLRNCTAATDSTAGVMSAANHTTLTSLSGSASGAAPGFIAVGIPAIAFLTGLDLKTNATTDIFTVPTSRTFIVTSAFVTCTAVTSGAAVAFAYQIRDSSGSAGMLSGTAAGSVAPTIIKVWPTLPLIGTSPYVNCTAANKVQIAITTGFTTSTAVTGAVWVLGCYVA